MCYMAKADRTERVGVRELRQNLSVYLRKVKAGRRIEVTEHGHPVAHLVPLPKGGSTLERLIAEGKVRPAVGDLLDLGMPPGPVSTKASEALDELREDRF